MNPHAPSVSIITPAYKRVDYLKEAIQSALAQTYKDFELIVCDDSSEEKINNLCCSFGDPRIIYRANINRLGIAMNNFAGFQAARSDLLTKLDDDDRWEPSFLEKLVPEMLSNPRICLAFSDHWLIDSTGQRMIEASEAQTTSFGRHLLKDGLVQQPKRLVTNKSIPLASSAVFRKSAIDWSLYSAEVGGAYDFFLSSCLVSSGMDIFYTSERLTEYRIHSGSGTSTRKIQNALDTLYVSERIYANPFFQDISLNNRKVCSYNSKRAGNAYLKEGKILPAVYYYVKSIKYTLVG